MRKPHKHAELIKAWADGAVIEIKSGSEWVETLHNQPNWYDSREYRIKPDPKFRPYESLGEAKSCLGKTIVNNFTGSLSIITKVYDSGLTIGSTSSTFREVFNTFRFEDGTPVGILEQ